MLRYRMLIQFSFSNFKSFKGESVLGLSATKITENSCHVFSAGNEKLLPAAAVFGANASGKSNMIEAFRFMATYVIFSFGYGGDSSDSELGLFRPHCVPCERLRHEMPQQVRLQMVRVQPEPQQHTDGVHLPQTRMGHQERNRRT